jgi:hypothetical protein
VAFFEHPSSFYGNFLYLVVPKLPVMVIAMTLFAILLRPAGQKYDKTTRITD